MYLRWVSVLMIAMVAGAQTQVLPEPDPIPMPLNRGADSYDIYSVLLDQGLKHQDAAASYWLVNEATTTEKRPSWPCKNEGQDSKNRGVIYPPPISFDPDHVEIAFNDPHNATPPPGHKVELLDVLDDFNLHCHERVTLSADGFHTALPVHFYKTLEPFTGFPTGVAGIALFSEVYFDAQHTRALVHQDYNCGDRCDGRQGWRFLERTDGHWQLRKGFLGYVDYSP